MTQYITKYYDRLIAAAIEHLEIVVTVLIISLAAAAVLTVICNCSKTVSRVLINLFSMIYSIPSLAMFALLIPFTGLGRRTAVIVLVIYNQYLLLRNFMAGFDSVDASVIEAATGMGMTKMQILLKIKLPLCKSALMSGIRIATVSTIGIATIAASINAGGLGTILFDGLRTMNIAKIVYGSIIAALMTVIIDGILSVLEKKVR